MEIDWFTVIAQIVNFLILVWLLKRFLYKPVLAAIDQREKKIASQLEDAANQKSEAQKEKQLFIRKNEEFDREHATQLENAKKRVEAQKKRLYEEARQETNELRIKLEDSIKQQEQELQEAIKRKTKEQVFAIAGKTLSDLASAELEEQVIKLFIKKMKSLNEEDHNIFKLALQASEEPIHIKSVFVLSRNLKQSLERAVNKIAERDTEFEYSLEPELVSGIVLETADFQLSWGIESYLESMKLESITK